ncbi:M28 family peptidase [Thermosphaera chiliense]|uniref:M28 family peptidase n=1 Tax=Thermosphaera chiliense TaxID=3402707 RepID=A0A7M1UU04_9CREN|nr:M28 family peptidase [Thermosphaera aggregans]QOR94384.1 M28 family peptidase [Thermosphaera aggregans]
MSEVIAGSRSESKIIRVLRNQLSEHVDWIDVLKTPVKTWIPEECSITIGNTGFKCIPIPYSLKSETEGYLSFEKDLQCGVGDIVLMKYPENYYSTSIRVHEAFRRGASAVILYEEDEALTRKTVVTDPPYPSNTPGNPPPIPVVTVDHEAYRALKDMVKNTSKLKATVRVVTVLKDSIGYTLVAGVNGSRDGEIHVATHHDHWFEGEGDSVAGLKTLVGLAKQLRKVENKAHVVLISFTAKELGSPYISPYPWSWGSRYFLQVMRNKGFLENTLYSVVIDSVHAATPTVYYHPSLYKVFAESLKPGWSAVPGGNHYSLDSLSYLLEGIPSMAITTLNNEYSWRIHYSSLDNRVNVNSDLIAADLAEFLVKTILSSSPEKIDARGLWDHVSRDWFPLEFKAIVAKARQAESVIGSQSVLRIATETFSDCASLRINDRAVFHGGLLSPLLLIQEAGSEIERIIGWKEFSISLQLCSGRFYSFSFTKINKEFVKETLSKVVDDIVSSLSVEFSRKHTFKVLTTFDRIQGGAVGEAGSNRS